MKFFNKLPDPPSGWEEYGNAEDWKRYCIGMREHDRQQWRKAVMSIFNPKDWAHDFRYALPVVLIGLVALLLNRQYRNGPNGEDYSYQYEDATSWDYRQLYAGWEAMCLGVYVKQWRYTIYRDGEWDL